MSTAAPPAAPTPEQDAAAQLAAAEAASAEAAESPQSILRDDRMYDLYWTHSPTDKVWVIISRREKKAKAKSRMPVILRNLAPDSVFDPRDAWHKEKAQRAETKAVADAEMKAAKAADGKKTKKEKEKKLTKADEIRLKNDETQRAKEVTGDMEKLDNALKAVKKGALAEVRKVKTTTPAGGLRKLLMVLEAALLKDDVPAAFDVLWAIEANKVFVAAEAEYLENKEDDKGDDKKKDKNDSKKDSKKDGKKGADDEKKKKKAPLSFEAELYKDFRKEVKKARELRKKTDLVAFQLTKMHDRLPPLSMYNRTFKLDQWQCRVLSLVDQDRSAIVCAPTSSGKTVISTYVAVKIAEAAKQYNASEGGVLFVVPSEPLVWQVAAMFEKMMPGQVALCTDLMAYRPESSFEQSNIVVGTPNALESALSKVRGKVGAERTARGQDYAQMAGGFQFRYAVFDEVHSLDGEEGAALQRIMRLVECPFLALSATIGNGEALRAFWSTVRASHKDCIPALVKAEHGKDAEARNPECCIEVHQGRFINLQRLVMRPSPLGKRMAIETAALGPNQEKPLVKVADTASTVELEPLHPCAAVTLELLQTQSFDSLSISFTPRDAYALYASLAKHTTDESLVADLEPDTFFAQFGDPKSHQITLAQAKEYEQAMKAKLEAMARDKKLAETARLVLADFAVDDASLEVYQTRLFEFAIKCREEALFPCLCFQLDSFRCLEMFKDLLGQLESRQLLEYPNYYDDLQAQADAARKKAVDLAKAAESGKKAKKGKDDEDGGDGGGEGEAEQETFVDTAAPHPSYVLSPPTARISSVEIDDILREMEKDKEPLPPNHPLARGLRRGIGMYIDDVGLSVYRRVVQRLAQQGKLAIVFSDHSLAYGVNMPFRTCAFCGDMGGLLTPLMAQQMSGRTGRRGLDTQGNIVYLGMQWPAIKNLILGKIPDIEGSMQHYPTMALQPVLSEYVDQRVARNAAQPSFKHYQTHEGGDQASSDYYDMSSRLLQELGLITDENKPATAFTGLTTCFELRTYGVAESLAVLDSLPLFMQDFVNQKPKDYGEKINVQVDFFARLLHFIDRQPPYKGVPGAKFNHVAGLPENTSLGAMSFITKYPERQASWDEWEAFFVRSQQRFEKLPADLKVDLEKTGAMASLKLPIAPGDPIDGMVFACILNNKLPLDLPSAVKHDLKKRLFYVGSVLMKMHNCLLQPGIYQGLELLLRKCFTRLKYVLTDAIRNETALTDSSGNMALAAAAEEAEAALVAKAAAEAAEEEQAALNALELDTTSSGSGAVEEVARGTEALNLAE